MRGRKTPETGNQPAPQLPPCKVCGEQGTGFHYGVTTCGACKGFFRRSLTRLEPYICVGSGHCSIGQETDRRKCCSKCRYEKCLAVGMSKDAIKTGRYSYEKKSKDVYELLEVRANKLASPQTFNQEKKQNVRSSDTVYTPESTNTYDKLQLPTALLQNKEQYSNCRDSIFDGNTSDEDQQKLHNNDTLSKLSQGLSLPCLAYTFVNDDLKRALKRKIGGNKEKEDDTQSEVPKLPSSSSAIKDQAAYLSPKRQASPLRPTSPLRQYSPKRQISPSKVSSVSLSVHSQSSFPQQTSPNVNVVQTLAEPMSYTAEDVGQPSLSSNNLQSIQLVSQCVPEDLSTDRCNSKLSVDVTRGISHHSCRVANTSNFNNAMTTTGMLQITSAPSNFNNTMTTTETPQITSAPSNLNNIITTTGTPQMTSVPPYHKSSTISASSESMLFHGTSLIRSDRHICLPLLHQPSNHDAKDLPPRYISPNSCFTNLSSDISSIPKYQDTITSFKPQDTIYASPSPAITHSTPHLLASVSPDLPTLSDDNSLNQFWDHSPISNIHIPTFEEELSLTFPFSVQINDLPSFDSLYDQFEHSKSPGQELSHLPADILDLEYRFDSSPDMFDIPENVDGDHYGFRCGNSIAMNTDSMKDQSSEPDSIDIELPSPYLEQFRTDAICRINNSLDEVASLSKDLSKCQLYSYELTLLGPLFDKLNISYNNVEPHQASAIESSGQSRPHNQIDKPNMRSSQSSDLPQTSVMPTCDVNYLKSSWSMRLSEPINHDLLSWCDFSEAYLHEVTCSLVASHEKHIGKDLNSTSQEEIAEKSALYLKVCRLKEQVFGKSTMLRDKDEYFKILEATGIDIDGTKKWTALSVKLENDILLKMVNFVKSIPGFKELCQEDKLILCKSSVLDLQFIGNFRGYDYTNNIFIYEQNLAANMEECKHLFKNYDDYTNLLRTTTRRIKALKLTVEELIVLKTICVTSPDVDGLKDKKSVESLYWQFMCCLLLSLHRRHPKPYNVYAKIITLIADFKVLNEFQWCMLEELKLEIVKLTSDLEVPLYKEMMNLY